MVNKENNFKFRLSIVLVVIVQSLSCVWLLATPRTAACQTPLSFTIFQSLNLNLLKFMSTESMMPSNHLILCHPLLLLHSIFPSIKSFPVSQLFTSGDQHIGASASASVLPMNIQDWLPLGFTGLISLLSKGLSRVFSHTTVWKHQFFSAQPSLWSNSHIHTWPYGPLLTKWCLWFLICSLGLLQLEKW